LPRRNDLRPGSIAALVLDAPAVAPRPTRPKHRTLSVGGTADIVLGSKAPGRGQGMGVGLLAAVALYVALASAAQFWAGNHAGPRGSGATPPLQVTQIEHVVDLAPPRPPIPSPLPRLTSRGVAATSRPVTPGPPAPAAAGQVVAAEPAEAEAADFTDFDIAIGQGTAYAGGVTASSGTGTSAVHAAEVDRNARPATGAGSHARPVGLPVSDWSCPWPPEAAALSIDEETVVVRAVVRPDGSVVSASLLSDPGHGFGAYAVECARAQRFQPALDDAGAAVTARSPPIRVHFAKAAR
jgi:TonB family protein